MKRQRTIIRFAAIITAALLSTATTFAQTKAIGVRFGGTGAELSYEHYAGAPHFFEGEIGVDWAMAQRAHFKATAMYNLVFLQPGWTMKGDWAMYTGAGLSFGAGDNFMLSFPIQLGLEYQFDFPLQLSADLRPSFGFITRNEGGIKFYVHGMLGFIPTVSARYMF